MSKINTKFSKEIKKFGAADMNACYNCGTCTAVCSLSTEDDSFPREMVRFSVLGLEEEIKSSLKPWSCYYCGECTESCPREAEPGELMMALRRWLTTQYDWTKLSGLLYKSLFATIIAFVLTTIGVIAFAYFKDFETKAIMHIGHLFEMIAIASVGTIIILPNIIKMYYLTVVKKKIKVPFVQYIKSLKELLVHMFIQKRAKDCEEDNNSRWFLHMILVFGYLALLFTTVVLDWFGTQYSFIIILGYVESVIIFAITFLFMIQRINKTKEVSKHSHPSDWFFIIWLFLMGLTAFAVRVFIDLDIIENNIWIYLVHITILVQWAVIIVPFGKWTHFIYRSFAMYFQDIIVNSKK